MLSSHCVPLFARPVTEPWIEPVIPLIASAMVAEGRYLCGHCERGPVWQKLGGLCRRAEVVMSQGCLWLPNT